jgi:hypothetical protein
MPESMFCRDEFQVFLITYQIHKDSTPPHYSVHLFTCLTDFTEHQWKSKQQNKKDDFGSLWYYKGVKATSPDGATCKRFIDSSYPNPLSCLLLSCRVERWLQILMPQPLKTTPQLQGALFYICNITVLE